MCICTWRGKGLTPGVPSCLPPKANHVARLASQQAGGSACLCPPHTAKLTCHVSPGSPQVLLPIQQVGPLPIEPHPSPHHRKIGKCRQNWLPFMPCGQVPSSLCLLNLIQQPRPLLKTASYFLAQARLKLKLKGKAQKVCFC